jgi:NAD(P)-dependent dehydrogenase (short-subunit alcohol dehydrogenase family)
VSSASDNSTGRIEATASQIPCRSQGFIPTSCHRACLGCHGPSVRGLVRQVADVAHAISFLASGDAGYVSGQVIYVTGGPLG